MIFSWMRSAIREFFMLSSTPTISTVTRPSDDSNITLLPVSSVRQFKRYVQNNKKQIYQVMLRRFDEERQSNVNYIAMFKLSNGSILKISRAKVPSSINKIYVWAIGAEEYEMCTLCSTLLPIYTTP